MPERLRHAGLRVATIPIRLYQLLISPALPAHCKYAPSCSTYALSALRSYGFFRGSVLAAWRILRCNPLSHGGYDPLEAQTLFRRHPCGDTRMIHSGEHEHDHRGALV